MKRRVVDHVEEQQVQWLENVFEALSCENDAVGLPRLAGERDGRMDGWMDRRIDMMCFNGRRSRERLRARKLSPPSLCSFCPFS